MRGFKEKFNRATQNKFEFLRLSGINISVKEKRAEFCYTVPSEYYDEVVEAQESIIRGINAAFETNLDVILKLKKSHFDEYFFALDVIKFFDDYPSLKGCVTKYDIKEIKGLKGLKGEASFLPDDVLCKIAATTSNDSVVHYVEISLPQSAYSLFVDSQMNLPLQEFLEGNYCEEIVVRVVQSQKAEEINLDSDGKYQLEGHRIIEVIPKAPIIGAMIHEKPGYIVDATEPNDRIYLCGMVRDLKSFGRKPKEDGKPVYNYYKFFLDDTTGQMPCIFFANEKTHEQITALETGKHIIVFGKLENNSFGGHTTLNLSVKKITECDFPESFTPNRLRYVAGENYKYIFPQPIIEVEQESVFNRKQEVASFLLDKEFVVFDLETTGLNHLQDMIIEIGAVKIVNGRLSESFSCFVDPCRPLPQRITELTGIIDDDVKDAHLANEVLPDFFKFCQNAVLVGHNIAGFDFPFLCYHANKYNIYFDNDILDTLHIARTHLKLKKFKLKHLAEFYGIKNPQSHRAVSDAMTTAKVFIRLAEYL